MTDERTPSERAKDEAAKWLRENVWNKNRASEDDDVELAYLAGHAAAIEKVLGVVDEISSYDRIELQATGVVLSGLKRRIEGLR